MLDAAVLAERTMAVERHLRRVAERLPATPDLKRVHEAATNGPADLRAFMGSMGRLVTQPDAPLKG